MQKEGLQSQQVIKALIDAYNINKPYLEGKYQRDWEKNERLNVYDRALQQQLKTQAGEDFKGVLKPITQFLPEQSLEQQTKEQKKIEPAFNEIMTNAIKGLDPEASNPTIE